MPQCKCNFKSGANKGERCTASAIAGSEFCGRHKECQTRTLVSTVSNAVACATQSRHVTPRKLSRINRYRTIDKQLQTLPDIVCMTDAAFLDVLTPGRVLGCGSFGEVILANLKTNPNLSIAIKMTGTRGVTRTKTSNEWNEITLLEKLSDLVKTGVTPHLPVLFHAAGCDTCTMERKTKPAKCILTMIELCDGTLNTLFDTPRSKAFCRNILFQVLAALHSVQKHLFMFHNDLKMPNLLFMRTTDTGCTEYTIRDTKYYLKNVGYTVILNDFGVSESTIGKIKLSGRKLTMTPDDRLILHNETLSIPAIASGREMVAMFSSDIIDSLTMFLGLPRASQHGMHPVIPDIPEDFKRELLDLLVPLGIKSTDRIAPTEIGHYYINNRIPGVRYGVPLDPVLTKFVDAGRFIQEVFPDLRTPLPDVKSKFNI